MTFPNLSTALKIASFILAAWVLVHVFAIFGIFFVIAYPIFWLFSPQEISCLFASIKKQNEYCPLCRQAIDSQEDHYPKSFSSAILNSLVILTFVFISFVMVFIESKVLFKLGFPPTPKTASFIIPSKRQYRLGEIFPMEIEILGITTPINAVQADVAFNAEKIKVVDVSTKNSFANIFIQKEINNDIGYVRLTGGLPNPGFFSNRGIFGTIIFEAKNAGIAQVEFLPSSMVLANDGRGTNILKEFAKTSYLILSERVTKEERLKQENEVKKLFLSKTTSGAQLKFYDEKEVLGIQTSETKKEIEQEKNINIIKASFNLIEEADRFTLSLWAKIFSLPQ